MSQYNIRPLLTMNEMPLMQEVEKTIWQMEPIPVHQLFTTINHGGMILGAFDGDNMIAFSYGFPGFDGERTYLCSHMLGILPDYQQDGLGEKMKQEQARYANQLGYDMMTWTFDPLQSMNAYLNLTKLGARGVYYKVNHYGAMNDRLNQGLETDRIVIEWRFNEDEPIKMPSPQHVTSLVDVHNGIPTARTDRFLSSEKAYTVAIPRDFHRIKSDDLDLAKTWRAETRKAFETLFANGFEAKSTMADLDRNLTYYYFLKGDIE